MRRLVLDRAAYRAEKKAAEKKAAAAAARAHGSASDGAATGAAAGAALAVVVPKAAHRKRAAQHVALLAARAGFVGEDLARAAVSLPPPDPERWLPKKLRAANQRKLKRYTDGHPLNMLLYATVGFDRVRLWF